MEQNLDFERLGKVAQENFKVNGQTWFSVAEAKDWYQNSLERKLTGSAH
jgi:hypothetical protein